MKRFLWILILILSISSCKKTPLHLSKIEGKMVAVDTTVINSIPVDNLIAPYKEKVEQEMKQVLAYSPANLSKNRATTESNIGNFMADLCYTRGNAVFNKQTQKNVDFTLLNFGGIRAEIPKGKVTMSNAYELMPFENNMVVVEMSYDKIQELLNYIAKSGKAHPISKQLRLEIANDKITSAKLNGKKFDKNRNYYVLTSDYLQHGGDRMNFFKNPIKLYKLDYKIRTAIIDELTEIDTLKAVIDGRVIRK